MNDDFHWISHYYGELAALSAAFLWSVASVLYSRIGLYLSPLKMNLLKNIIAMVMAMIVLWGDGGLFVGLDKYAMSLLLLSGAVGIGLGDSAYFGALKYIGARRALLITILSPPITGILAILFLGENLSPRSWLGVFITVAGVSWVITERVARSGSAGAPVKSGILLGLLAAMGQASGAVLSHAAFIHINISPIRSERKVADNFRHKTSCFFTADSLRAPGKKPPR
jgi:drug/metabolite transporter (DMT)-like permease